MSKINDVVRKLASQGWSVNKDGMVTKPDGTIRNTSVKKGKPTAKGHFRTDYLIFSMSHNGSSVKVPVHKLAAFNKFGNDALQDKTHVRHLNNDSLDNKPSNIGIGTALDNYMDRSEEERNKFQVEGSSLGGKVLRKLSDEEVCHVRSSPKSSVKLAEELNIPRSCISYIRNDKTYKDVVREP